MGWEGECATSPRFCESVLELLFRSVCQSVREISTSILGLSIPFLSEAPLHPTCVRTDMGSIPVGDSFLYFLAHDVMNKVKLFKSRCF